MFIVSVFAALFLSTNLYGMEVVQRRSLEFSIMTYNVCNYYGMVNDEKSAHITWDKRKDRIFALILDEKPDVIGFQELRDDNGKSTIKDLWNGLGDHGYDIQFCRWDSSPYSFINAIAYNKIKFMCDSTDNWWLSDQPYICSPMARERPRRVLMLSLCPVVKNIGIDYSHPVYIANVHHSTNHVVKLQSNKILVDQIKARTQLSSGVILITGDFNTLDNDSQLTANELSFLKKDGYVELLTDLKTKKDKYVSGTFVGYSSDKHKNTDHNFGSQLDHIFFKTLSPDISYESQSHVNTQRYNGNDVPNPWDQDEMLRGINDSRDRDEFPSDHIPGIVNLKVFFNEK